MVVATATRHTFSRFSGASRFGHFLNRTSIHRGCPGSQVHNQIEEVKAPGTRISEAQEFRPVLTIRSTTPLAIMHRESITPLVYRYLFPNPKPNDPTGFQAHITRNLVPEVRAETLCFYGTIDCLESQYPGLDYAKPAHRLRLSRYVQHRKLFQAFDYLRLSDHEIQTLCKWEGTRWARERFEKDEGVTVRDTTWDDIAPCHRPHPTVVRGVSDAEMERENGSDEVEGDEDEDEDEQMEDEEGEGESEDELQQSVGVELNQRLVAAIAARARGEDATLDADWEQWLKEAAERGAVPEFAQLPRATPNQGIPRATPNQGSHQTQSTYGQNIPQLFQNQPGSALSADVAAMRARVGPPPPFVGASARPPTFSTSSSSQPPAGTAM